MYVASTDHKVQKFNRRGEVVKSIGENGGMLESLMAHLVSNTTMTKSMFATATMPEYRCLTLT